MRNVTPVYAGLTNWKVAISVRLNFTRDPSNLRAFSFLACHSADGGGDACVGVLCDIELLKNDLQDEFTERGACKVGNVVTALQRPKRLVKGVKEHG